MILASTLLGTVAVVIVVVAFQILAYGIPETEAQRQPVPRSAIVVGTLIVVLVMMIGSVMVFAGQCYCLATPKNSGAYESIETNVFLQVVSVLLAVSAYGTHVWFPDYRFIWFSINGLAAIFAVGSFFCFLRFLRNLAIAFGHDRLIRHAKNVSSLSLLAMFAPILVVGIISLATESTAPIGSDVTFPEKWSNSFFLAFSGWLALNGYVFISYLLLLRKLVSVLAAGGIGHWR